jgi:mannan endo-1,4-beta-mannosidase
MALMLSSVVSSGCATEHHKGGVVAESAGATEHLYSRLRCVVDSGKFIFGHHDDTAYGHTWSYQEGRSDVREVAGDYPGLMNWDLGLVEYGADKELDGVPFDFIRDEVRKQDARGGINSFSWHVRNPATGGDSWDTSLCKVHEIVTPGTALNDTVTLWLNRCADFFLSLKDGKGERIPVLFRPWHEHTGSWFWWGKDLCSADDYKALWKLTREVFDKKGVDNILWVYSPDNIRSAEEYTERYPGDDYVDVLGADVYHYNAAEGLEDYLTRARRQLDAATALSHKNHKLVTLSETGAESIPMENWWTEVLLPLCSEYNIAYVCVWRNACDKPQHFYAPFPEQKSVASFIQFYNNPKTLFAKDLKAFK